MLFAEYEPVILLCRTLTDFDHHPKTASGVVRRRAEGGLLAVAKIECAECEGEGAHRSRGRVVVPCKRCGGGITVQDNGDVAIEKGRGWVEVDPYDREAEPVGSERTGEVIDRRRWVRCDSCGGPRTGRAPGMHGNGQECRCADSGKPGYVLAPERTARPWRDELRFSNGQTTELGPDDPVVMALEMGMPGAGKAYEQRVESGDYEQLGLALACLRLDRLSLYRLLVSVYVLAEREPEELHVDEALSMAVALHYVRALMPDEIRVPSWAARYEKRRRERVESNGKVAA